MQLRPRVKLLAWLHVSYECTSRGFDRDYRRFWWATWAVFLSKRPRRHIPWQPAEYHFSHPIPWSGCAPRPSLILSYLYCSARQPPVIPWRAACALRELAPPIRFPARYFLSDHFDRTRSRKRLSNCAWLERFAATIGLWRLARRRLVSGSLPWMAWNS